MFNRLRIHNQLTFFYSAGIFVFALVTALIVTSVTKAALYARVLDEGLSLTENLASQSARASSYPNKKNAAAVANGFYDFPDVIGVEFLDENLKHFYQIGDVDFSSVEFPPTDEAASITQENKKFWVLVAPVVSANTSLTVENFSKEQELNSITNTEPTFYQSSDIQVGPVNFDDQGGLRFDDIEPIGFVRLVISKKSLHSLSNELFLHNLIVSFILGVVLFLAFLYVTRRLTRPIVELPETMLSAQNGKVLERAKLDSSQDVYEIGNAFNTVMKNLQRQEAQIKSTKDDAFDSTAEKMHFTGNVSHNIHTPVNDILNMLELLPDNDLTDTQIEYLRIAKKSAESLLPLLNNVSNYSDIEPTSARQKYEEFNLVELLDEIIERLSVHAQEKNIDFCYILEGSIPIYMQGDIEKIRQVLINLARNALKRTLKGTVSIHVMRCETICPKGMVNIAIDFSVRDTGVGVDSDAKKKMFKDFSQENHSVSHQLDGTDLDFSGVRHVVEVLGGDLAMSSKPGRGNEFSFTLELTPSINTYSSEYYGLENAISSALVITSNAILSQSLSGMLKGIVAKIFSAEGINEALNVVNTMSRSSEVLHLVILDATVNKNFDFFCTLRNNLMIEDSLLVLVGGEQGAFDEQVFNPCLHLPKPATRQRLLVSIRDKCQPVSKAKVDLKASVSVESQDTRLHGKRILVVEDIEANWLVTQGMLKTLGCDAFNARNGKEGLEKIKDESFDLILMDCHMPIMDGYSATSSIRELESDGDDHKVIIAMTANNLSDEREKCIAAGMDDFLPKPVSRLDLKNVLLHWLAYEKKLFNAEQLEGDTINSDKDSTDHKGIVDVVKIMELSTQMGDAMPTLVASFTAHIEEHLQGMKDARLNGDRRRIKFIAHAIKGSASNFGATLLVAESKELEATIESLSEEQLSVAITNVEQEGKQVISYLNNL